MIQSSAFWLCTAAIPDRTARCDGYRRRGVSRIRVAGRSTPEPENTFQARRRAAPIDTRSRLARTAMWLSISAHSSRGSLENRERTLYNQDVWHYHLHVIPRYTGDDFYATRGENIPAPQRAQLARQLRANLAEWRSTS